jgi:putative endonuclease
MRDHDYWVYILTNKHRTTLYIGMTNDLELRLWQHRWGEKSFAKRYHLNRLVWFEHFRDVNDAIACEKRLKGWLRSRKIALIEKTNPHWLDLSEEMGAGTQCPGCLEYRRNGQRFFAPLRMT